MKIEKLTENKIRIIINQEELENTKIDVQQLLSSDQTSQELLLRILKTAKKEIGFDTDGHKLFIETFSSSNEAIVFTITKFQSENEPNPEKSSTPSFLKCKYPSFPSRKKIGNTDIKRKIKSSPRNFKRERVAVTLNFYTFDNFCNFCTVLKDRNIKVTRKIVKNSSLILYDDNVYLTLSGFNVDNKTFKKFTTLIIEFADFITYNNNFDCVLKEHGQTLIKEQPIPTTIKYFT